MSDSRRISLGTVGEASSGIAIRPTSDLGAPDHVAYSRFKHGCGANALRFGALLADRYWRLLPSDRQRTPHLVACSAYAYAPPAAHALVGPFVTQLRRLAGRDGVAMDATVFKIHRGRLAGDDYARLSASLRSEVIATSDLRLPGDLELPAGAQVVAIDDVRATGLHAQRVDALYHHHDVTVWHACLLEIDDERQPTLEAVLNAGAVDAIGPLVDLANETTYVLNARACRFVLAEVGRVAPFVDGAPLPVAKALLRYASDDGLGHFPRYAEGYQALARALAAPRTAERTSHESV